MTTLVQELTGDWTEVVGALSLSAGTSYYVEALDGAVELRVSALGAPPGPSERGRLVWPGTASRPPDSRTYTPAAGEFLHARSQGARAALVLDTEA